MLKSSIKVYARIKPTLDYNSDTHSYIIQRDSNKNNEKECLIINPSLQPRIPSTHHYSFKFNRVFPPKTSQSEFYETVGRPVVNRLLSGYNGAIFAFGQTGTGKTHAIIGDLTYDITKGLISRVFDDIFTFIRKNPSFKYNLSISSVEIYNDVCYDLITIPDSGGISSSRVTIMEDPEGNINVLNLNKYNIQNMKDVMNYLQISLDNRVVADTPMNRISSRSHFIFTVYLDQQVNGVILSSKLNLIDLAGSERLSKRKSSGFLFNETKSINLSLHYLENVIIALSNPKRRHIPYRNSFLTLLLRDSLGGNCCTAMIVTISLENQNFNETIATSRFAQRVSLIKNEPRISYQYNEKQLNVKQEPQEIPILEKNLNKSKQKLLKILNDENISNSKKSIHEETQNSEYMNYTINHINRGIKLLSTLLNQVPHLLKHYKYHSKEDLSKRITNTLGLELPRLNPFTGENYLEEQKLAFMKFLSTKATNKALLKYLQMNFTYYKYLEIDWHLWKKERNIAEKIRETELKMKSALKYGDFPEVIDKLCHTYDKYVEQNRINSQECQSMQKKKQESLKLFMDGRTQLFQAFEIWWQRHKQLNNNVSLKVENHLSNEIDINENRSLLESKVKNSIKVGIFKETLKQLDEESIKYQIDIPVRSKNNSNDYTKINSKYQSFVSPKSVISNSFIKTDCSILNTRNNHKRINYENKNLDLDEESSKIKSPISSKYSPMLFSLQTRSNSKYQSPITSNVDSSNSIGDKSKNANTNYQPVFKRNSNIQQIRSNVNEYFNKSEENNSIFFEKNDRENSPIYSRNRPMLSIICSTENLRPKSSVTSICSNKSKLSCTRFKTNDNDSISGINSGSYLENDLAINSPFSPVENHGENMSLTTSLKTKAPMICTLQSENSEDTLTSSLKTKAPMICTLQSENSEDKDTPVKLKLTGDEDLDSRILDFYKSQHVSVIF